MNLDQITELVESSYQAEYFVWQIGPGNKSIEQFYLEEVFNNLDERAIALAQHTGDYYTEDYTRDYLVLTDDEATERAEESAQNKLEDELYNIPEHLRAYFDREKFIEDHSSDRGFELNYWDGQEHEETVNGTTYYIYRQ